MRVSTNSLITEPLDRLEASLPTLPSKAVSLGRATARRTNDVTCAIVRNVSDSMSAVFGTSSRAARTVGGQARDAADRSTDAATTGARTVAGQARSASGRTADVTSSGARTVAGQAREAADRAASTAAGGARNVTGQARAAAEDTAATTRSGARTVAGQAGAQARKTARRTRDEAEDLVDDATDAIDPATPLEDRTKEELYEQAQERDIEGRSTMSKGELVAALREDGA